jgi:hypothetical protein
MIAPFDIFRINSADGALLWCATADSLESAKQRVQALSKTHRSQFVIVSIKTGRRLTIDPTAPENPDPA